MRSFKTGIHHLEMRTYFIEEFFGKDSPQKVAAIKVQLERPEGIVFLENGGDKEEVMIINENNQAVVKRLVFLHKDSQQNDQTFELWQESDGTRRLFELAPGLFKAVYTACVVMVDEIENNIQVLCQNIAGVPQRKLYGVRPLSIFNYSV